MPALAIDTATDVCTIALGNDGGLVDEITILAGRSHLEMLLPQIHVLLGRQGLKIADIDAIIAGIGPGSFTGLRVGVATARGLAQALKKPIFGSSTLRALAQGMIDARGEDVAGERILPVVDAKRGQVFAQLFLVSENKIAEAASEILCLEPEDLFRRLPGLTGDIVLAAGSGVLAYWNQFDAAGQVEAAHPEDPLHLVQAAFHLSAWQGGSYEPRLLQEVLPAYVREPDADKTVLLRKREPWLK